ncbi:AraC-like DNA-binding protein [Flavobacterium sp. 2755]|uniref:AraC family transcriptional regulator n=1 Tax=Flavobacterium sp. 2755 TaxID=2817765 RepID=UPI002862E3EA|nr:AraC family transcriptional regulator [Flavobacterium sp. 2755]MDR6763684.1 AraC-like DNA-binding protein [Flavobacterium sp. 2755]
MKKETPIIKLESVTDIHRIAGLSGPVHPMITIIDAIDLLDMCKSNLKYVLSFYKIILVTKMNGKFKYGQGHYDFNEGSLIFASPNQVVGKVEADTNSEGISIFIHPDFLQGFPLAGKIKQYGFFSYAANEALHLSEQERTTMQSIFSIIRDELNSRIDDFSREVIIAQIELLLSYAKRFHKRQFLTRQVVNNDLLQQFEDLLNKYFEEKAVNNGMPTVQYLAETLNYTPNYLSDMLRSLTGLNAQQHIHQKLIEKSKDLLSTTSLTINEVAYQLGFDYPQSFSRLFKLKTKISPAQYRSTFG